MSNDTYVRPETHVYTGHHKDVTTQVVQIVYDKEGVTRLEGFERTVPGKRYIRVTGLSDVEKILAMKETHAIGGMTLEDVFNVHQRNKIELHEGYLFPVFNVMVPKNHTFREDYFSVIMTEDSVISFHETEPLYLDPLIALIKTDQSLRGAPVDRLFHAIMDIVTDIHLDVHETLDEDIAEVEDAVLGGSDIDQERFYLLRKRMLRLKTSVQPMLEQFKTALERGPERFSARTAPYHRDLLDHLERLDGRINLSRESMRQLLDLHMNNQSARMNGIMMTLTVFSAIFIPLSFLTGFFGMNFVHFGILSYTHGVLMFTGVAIVIAIVMILFFKMKRWF
jgi:magnesium transporter